MLYQIEKKEFRLYASAGHQLSPIPHIHTHLELIYMLSGSSVATLDNKEFTIEAGDFFLAFPHQIHFYRDCGPLSEQLVIFPFDFFKEFKMLFQSKVPVSPIIKSEDIEEDLRPLLATLFNKILVKSHSPSAFDQATAKGCLLTLLGEILPLMKMLSKDSSNDSIKNVMSYCSQNYTEPLSLDTISRELHLSKYYISRIFRERMDIGFNDFINSLRIEHACGLLEKGANMTEIAFTSGFSSIRTFNRVFAKHMGMSPREYLKDRK